MSFKAELVICVMHQSYHEDGGQYHGIARIFLCDINTNSCVTTVPNYTLQKVKISK